MGVPDWFKSKSTDADEPAPSASQEEQEEVEDKAEQATKRLQNRRLLSLKVRKKLLRTI